MLHAIDYESLYILGDFNADPSGSRSWNNLMDFVIRNNLTCIDTILLDNNRFTFISHSHGSSKWLDHIIGRSMNGIGVKSVKVLNDIVGSDHFPIPYLCLFHIGGL